MWGREPVAIAAAIRAVILAAVLFGLDMTQEQIAGTMLAVEAILALITRQAVTSPATIAQLPKTVQKKIEEVEHKKD